MSKREERLEAALNEAVATLEVISQDDMTRTASERKAAWCLERVNAILNPPPAFEAVPVVRWFNPARNAYREVEPPDAENRGYIKLTGTITRPKPEPVEKSVSVECGWVPVSTPHGPKIYYPATIDHGFDWGQFEGKTGTLTFTWTQGA